MTPLTTLSGLACPLPLASVDTDQLIPARFMKTPRSAGYGQFLLHDLRRDEHGQLRPDWALNTPAGSRAQVLVARRNFGAGSSREAAVYALVDHGIRCVVAPSFGDIFASNAVNNGLLPAQLDEPQVDRILALLGNSCHEFELDLEQQRLTVGSHAFFFALRADWRTKLLNGWDDIDLTLSFKPLIAEFAQQRAAQFPWLSPEGGSPVARSSL